MKPNKSSDCNDSTRNCCMWSSQRNGRLLFILYASKKWYVHLRSSPLSCGCRVMLVNVSSRSRRGGCLHRRLCCSAAFLHCSIGSVSLSLTRCWTIIRLQGLSTLLLGLVKRDQRRPSGAAFLTRSSRLSTSGGPTPGVGLGISTRGCGPYRQLSSARELIRTAEAQANRRVCRRAVCSLIS
nr:epithelial membrane protein 2 isoform X1 [Nothobranchius furzeri]